MKKILLIGTFNEENACVTIRRGFDRYDDLKVVPYPYRRRLVIHQQDAKKRDQEIVDFCIQRDIDLVVVLKGNNLLPETVAECRKYTKVLLWYMDALRPTSDHYQTLLNALPYYNYAVFSLYDAFLHAQKLLGSTKGLFHVNDGFDPEWDKPIENIRPVHDIGFVGALYGNRKDYYAQLQFVHTTECYRKQLAYQTARTKINLSFTNSGLWEHNGPSVRSYKVLAHKGFLLIEEYPHMHQYGIKPNVDFATFKSKDDVIKQIDYYLDHPELRKRITENGYRTVQNFSKYHTVDKLLQIADIGVESLT